MVYDVKEYMPEHPGGPEYIGDNLGTNIEEEFEEAEHTKTARKIFKDLPIVGKMVKKGDELSQNTANVGEKTTTENEI